MKKTLLTFLAILFGTSNLFATDWLGGFPIDSTTLNSSSITGTVTLTNDKVYLMKGFNYVRNGGAIVIQPGSLILGDFDSKGTLIVERGGIIHADGTRNQPIVFTSEIAPGQRAPGDWGGIIVLGRSGINTSSGADSAEVEGFGPGLGPIFGGQPRIDDDSSGVMRYCRLEFSGINLTGISGNEINGLTMGGVGSRTVIEYIQISYCGDDSFEWFGGNVNARYLISYKAVDDDWDCDNGYRGKVQFGLSVRDSSIFDVSTSNGFEIDNNNNNPASGTYNGPRTEPIFSNMTVVGPFVNTSLTLDPLWGRGAHTRRANLSKVYNSIIMGWRTGVRFDGAPVLNAALGDTIQWRNTIFAGNVRLADSANVGSVTFNAQSWLQTGSFSNTVFAAASGAQLTDPFGIYPTGTTVPVGPSNWMPQPGSPALTGADFSNPNLSSNFFTPVNFRGAFGTDNWLDTWTQFDPQNYTPTPIGINQISESVPEKFMLSQNYPNPFNPETKISFSIPSATFVTLKVFDATGREVANLVNQNLTVGTYEYSFNASRLTSGVYFYTLKTEKFTETKKMLLVK